MAIRLLKIYGDYFVSLDFELSQKSIKEDD